MKKGFAHVLILILILVIGVAGYVLFKTRTIQPQGDDLLILPFITPTPNTGPSWLTYHDDKFNISFEYPSSWEVQESVYPLDDYRGLTISTTGFGEIIIERDKNTENLTPKMWFIKHKNSYNQDLIKEIAETEINGNPAYIFGQPLTCDTVALLVTMISHDKYMFTFAKYGTSDNATPGTLELERLLETLNFDNQQDIKTQIPSSLFVFPKAPDNYVCDSQ